jgi:outer membrane protein OmpA-like peptidoglycan-associated protein
MTTYYLEVPAHVQLSDHQSNHTDVKGGTNWDLSRSAVATPISPAIDPQPIQGAPEVVLGATPYQTQHRMPSVAPAEVVRFGLNSIVVPVDAQKLLRGIPKGTTVVIAGHSDPDEKNPVLVAKRRAEAVAAILRKQGKRVEAVRSFAADLPLAQSPLKAQNNRRVEVFAE